MTSVAIVGAREFGTNRDGTKNQAVWDFMTRIFAGLEKKFDNFVFVSGGAKGADSIAEWMANRRGHDTRVYCLHSNCSKGHIEQAYGWERRLPDGTIVKQNDAGFKRNEVIVENADVVVAFIHEQSKGTRHTVHLAQEAGKEVHLFHAYSFERLTECPCEDDETHKRIKNARIYQTVSIAERDETLDGGDASCNCPLLPHFHTVAAHEDNEMDEFTAALWAETECQTCGREMEPGEGCKSCSAEVYGVIEREEEPEETCSDPEKHLTCKCASERNYYIKPRYIPVMRDPWMQSTTKRLVNGHWLYTKKDGKAIYPTLAAEQGAEAHLRSLPQGPYTL